MAYFTPQKRNVKAFVEMSKDLTKFYVYCPFELKNKAKSAGGTWEQSKKVWMFAFTPKVVEVVKAHFGEDIEFPMMFGFILSKKIKEESAFLNYRDDAEKDVPIEFEVDGIAYEGRNPLYNYQKHGIRCANYVEDGFLIGDVMGLGKGVTLNTLISTPYGKKTIGLLKVGDEVIGKNGKVTKVTGVFPQGLKDVYKITFNDGYSVECDKAHLWSVALAGKEEYKTISTEQLIDKNCFIDIVSSGHGAKKIQKCSTYYKSEQNNKWHIPLVEPIEFKTNDVLPIDPYLLGLCLGGGRFNGRIVKFEVGKDDFKELFDRYFQEAKYLVEEKKQKYETTRACNFYFQNELTDLKLKNIRAWNKFIPDIYKYSSVENRLAILQGLMDTDGHCMSHEDGVFNGTEYCSVSEQLTDDVAELVHSLGGIVRKKSKIGSYKKKDGSRKICRRAYRLNIKMPSQFNPFRLKRKQECYQTPKKYDINRYIENIKYIGKKETVCISVDAEDKLYVLEHGIVTHNTIQGLGIAITKKNAGLIKNCLIVCPASLKYNWLNEIKKFTKETAIVIEGTKEQREQQWISQGAFFKIVNYELFTYDLFWEPLTEKEKKSGKKKERPDIRISSAQFVLNGFFDMCIVDEIHYCKSHNSLRTRAIKKIKTKFRLGLTGTPMDGKLEELHCIFDFIKPGLFPSKSRFLDNYAIKDFFGSVTGYKNVGEVKEKIKPFYIRRLKDNVLKDLPEVIYSDIFIEFEPTTLKLYKDLAQRKNKITANASVMETLIRCRQFCNFPELLNFKNASEKFARLYEMLKELVCENKEKIIIFTQYKSTLDLLSFNLKDEFDLVFIHGQVSPKDRFEIVEDFNKNPKRQIIIMTDAGCTGLNITGANNVIHYDDNYSPSIMLQRNGRSNRIGQKKVVTVFRFICKDTMEEKIRTLLEKKQAINNLSLDENCNELSLGGLTEKDILESLND